MSASVSTTLVLVVCFLLADPAARPIALLLERVFPKVLDKSDEEIHGLSRFTSVTITMSLVAYGFALYLAPQSSGVVIRPPDLVLAVFGGVACFGFSQILASLLRELPLFRADLSQGRSQLNKRAMSAGWLRYYRDVYSCGVVPLVVLVFLYVATEEMIFRFVLTELWGEGLAGLGVSTVLFALAQLPGYSWNELRFAFFPVVGAIAMGPVNFMLYRQTHNILVVCIAHFVFFLMGFLFHIVVENRHSQHEQASS